MKRILLAAGGTGGHIVPGLAVAAELSSAAEVIFIGTGKELERKLICGAGYQLEELPAAPLLGKGPKGVLNFAALFPRAFSETRMLYRKLTPQAVMGFGGYPTVIPALAAFSSRVPLILHESNVRVGLANRTLSLLATQVFAVRGSGAFWNSRVTRLPNPVRGPFYAVAPYRQPAAGERWRLLVTGGSQGAVSLNTAVLELAPLLRERGVEVWHQAGANDALRVEAAYREAGLGVDQVRVAAFVENFADALSWSHFVVCRAGAMTVAEISAAGRPAIFVPLPIAGGHQADNCRELVCSGLSREVAQVGAFASKLRGVVEEFIATPEKLQEMASGLRDRAKFEGVRPAQFIAAQVLRIAGI